MARFVQANLLDCKISAYPWYADTENGRKNANKQAPNLIFIDHDFKDFRSEKAFNKAVDTTVSNIANDLGGRPTVIGSGHGCHVYQPIDVPTLENYQEFLDLANGQPSRRFLQYMESRLSGTKSDSCHNHTMSLRNCMLRIPGSYNAKTEDLRPVELLQSWDNVRPKVSKDLLFDFYLDLCDRKIKEYDDKDKDKDKSNSKYYKLTTSKPYHNCRYFQYPPRPSMESKDSE
jgi:hypothetical protein